MLNTFSSIFVHQYRDLDQNIHTECIKAVGSWFTHYPAYFLNGSYLQYVDWVLSDSSMHVHLEAVQALAVVYVQSKYVGSLTHFTKRFKPRLLKMAGEDTKLSICTAIIGMLSAINSNALLEDEERAYVFSSLMQKCVCRKAVSPFVAGMWQEEAGERATAVVGCNKGEKVKSRAGIKALAMLLVK